MLIIPGIETITMTTIKCIITGDSRVGVTSFISKHKTGHFVTYPISNGGPLVTSLSFHTNYGKVEFELFERETTEEAFDCAIIMFDLQNRKSFDSVMDHYNTITKRFGNIPVVLCGNKVDYEERVVTVRNIGELIHLKQPTKFYRYFDVSAFTNYNFEKPFLVLMRKVLGFEDLRFDI